MSNRFVNNLQILTNAVLTRTQWLKKWLDPKRDIDAECGHPEIIDISDYKKKFRRNDVSNRVISIYPKECWKHPPFIYETEDEKVTEFEKQWNLLQKRFNLNSIFLRADILSGIGRFGIILLGLDDNRPLNTPVNGIDESGNVSGTLNHKLIYIRPLDESNVKIKQYQTQVTSPRFGQPLIYEINFTSDILDGSVSVSPAATPNSSLSSMEVHWTRVIHLADNRLDDDVFGRPRLEVAYDRALDLAKVAGGSGEMFWKGGFPGLAIETQPSDEPIKLDKEATKEEMEQYMEGLKRYLALEGVTAKTLASAIEDPTPHAELQLKLIALAIECPWRIFVGAEVGQLASGQDIVAWNERLMCRRETYITPHVIRPLIDRLIMFGVLPKPTGDEDNRIEGDESPNYIIYWDDLNTPSNEEKANVAEKRTNAIAKYVAGACDQLISPKHFWTLIIGLSDEEAESIIEETGDRLPDNDPDEVLDRDMERRRAELELEAEFAPEPDPTRRNGTPRS